MVCQEIKDFLAAHADARYAAFVTSLMPGTRPVVGVRLPVLRAWPRRLPRGIGVLIWRRQWTTRSKKSCCRVT